MNQALSRAPQKRSEIMRQRLMDATLDVIHSLGWSKASTPEICRHAGISRGAQTHHFATKKELLLAAINQVSSQHLDSITQELGSQPNQDSLTPYLEVLWSACNDERFLQSWIEVMVAARTDADLRTPVAKLDETAIDQMRETGALYAQLSEQEDLVRDLIDLTVYLLRGMLVQRGVHDDTHSQRRLFGLWCSMVEAKLAQVTA